MKIKQLPIEPRFDIEVTLDQLITIKHALVHYAGAHRDFSKEPGVIPGGRIARESQEYASEISKMAELTEMALCAAHAERYRRDKSRPR